MFSYETGDRNSAAPANTRLAEDDDNEDYEEYDDYDADLFADYEQFARDNSDDDPDFSDPDLPENLEEFNADDQESLDDEDVDLFLIDDEADAVDGNEMEDFHHALKAAHGFKKGLKARRGKDGRPIRRARGEVVLSFEVRNLLGDANQAFAVGDLDRAFSVLKHIIHIEPTAHSAWKTLGEVFKERGDVHKCLLAWLTAAHIMPRDWELWHTCAKMSLAQYGPDKKNYRDQAVYCYRRAISANPDGIDLIYERSVLLKDMGQLNKAADGFAILNRLLPNDPPILREMAAVYIEMERIQDAIDLYTASVNFFKSTGNKKMAFDWSMLNILVELYMMQKRWKEAIATIKNIGRWLSGRASESYWEKWTDDDREWDTGPERRVHVPQYKRYKFKPETYTLPIELRVKLGICRLKLGNPTEALTHFEFLQRVGSQEYADLYQEVADGLSEAGKFEDALYYYTAVTDDAAFLDHKLWMSTANCYRVLGQIDEAEDTLTMIIEAYPRSEDAMLQLAEIYEVSNRKDDALELVNRIIKLRRQRDAAGKGKQTGQQVPVAGEKDKSEDIMSFLPNQPVPKKNLKRYNAAPTIEQKIEMEAKKTEQVAIKFRQLEYLTEGMKAGEPVAVKSWLDTAGELVDEFRNTKALYPSERSSMYRGFVPTARKRAAAQGADVQLEKMQHRLEESLAYQDDEIEEPEQLVTFRGLDFDQWLYIFCQYALGLTLYEGNYDDAYLVCSGAKESTIFYHDKNKIFVIYSTWLACATHAGDSDSCSTITRWFMAAYQFQSEAYSLFTTAVTLSRNGLEVFHNNANQKYLLRQIKAMDEAITGIKRTGAAGYTGVDEDGNEYRPTDIDVNLLMLYGHILASGKSYVSALNYYTRVYAVAPEHPMVLFSIALAYIHRSMQRQSENRHLQVLQGVTFLFEYFERRPASPDLSEVERQELQQEVEYNVARAFHHLGLSHLSIPYYERVLKISDEWGTKIQGDLKWEAAYNLQMIYITSGNPQLAQAITERYLVI